MHNNPYFPGKDDAQTGDGTNKNPYPDFSEKWALYNNGYNLNNPQTADYFHAQLQAKKAKS